MNQAYDPMVAQAVWSRVLQTQPLEENTLTDWIATEMGSARAYRAMARRERRFSQRFLQMAREEELHARRLRALYFLLFGQKPRVLSGAADTARAFGTALKTYYHGEVAARDTYRTAARQWREHAEMFGAIADDEARHAQMLQRITAEYL